MKRLVILLLAIFALNSYAQEYVTLEQDLKSATIIQYTIKGRFMSR